MTYFLLLIVVSVVFSQYSLELMWTLFGSVEVITFFYFSNFCSVSWNTLSDNIFEKRLFWTSLIIRIVYVLFSYILYMSLLDSPFDFDAADALHYDDLGNFVAEQLSKGHFNLYERISQYTGADDIADMGFGIYIGIVYLITDNSILVVRLLKALWSALTVKYIYRIAKYNFGNDVGKLAGIFCMLMPNLIFYCGLHLKEVEMVFLCVWCIYNAEIALHAEKLSFNNILMVLLSALLLASVRTVLALIAVFSFFIAVVFLPKQVISINKKIIIGIFVVFMIAISVGNRIVIQSQEMIETVTSDHQERNMAWRSVRENGNQFAKYAGAAVFAPLIFTIPFPTMVEIPNQNTQKQIHGGNFIKNVLSIFTIFAMFFFVRMKRWRNHILILAYFIGYLLALILSEFAQSERFHQPIIPFEMMYAAFAISIITKRQKKFYNLWLIFIFAVGIFWQWFKLAGREMI